MLFLALKLGKEDSIGSGCVQGATKSGMMAQRRTTRENYVRVGCLGSVVKGPRCHYHFYA